MYSIRTVYRRPRRAVAPFTLPLALGLLAPGPAAAVLPAAAANLGHGLRSLWSTSGPFAGPDGGESLWYQRGFAAR